MIDINITVVIQTFNFLALYYLLKWVFFEPILKVMDARNTKLRSLARGFKDEKDEIAKLQGEYDSSMREIYSEAGAIRSKSKEEAESEKKSLLQKANEEAARLLAQKKKTIDTSVEELETSLNSEVVGLQGEVLKKFIG
ncbi:MAG: ATP synthase F0 subunit B [Candidatus Cloacimonetes bacterium]|nr:ATP synthase F0 subunit B [Candidatus Cloacimonadota bacterium]